MGLLPPAPSRRRTTILAFMAVVAVIAVIGLSLALFGSGITNSPQTSQSPQITNIHNLTVDSFTFNRNSTDQIEFNVSVTNHGNSTASFIVSVIIGQGKNLTIGQPYPTRQTPVNNPSFSGSENAMLAADENKGVLVDVAVPESFSFDSSMVFISLQFA